MAELYIGLFKKPYTVRQHKAQTVVNGYASAPYADTVMRLNVQPLSSDELLALPDGERTVKRVKSFGPDRLTAADEFDGIPGDRLFYNGRWWECTSSVMWDHTILAHYRSDFVILPQREQTDAPTLEPPNGGASP